MKEVCKELSLNYEDIDKDDFSEFIVWSGYLEEDFNHLNMLPITAKERISKFNGLG